LKSNIPDNVSVDIGQAPKRLIQSQNGCFHVGVSASSLTVPSSDAVKVRVERSKSSVIFALPGANGPISWRDLQVSSEEAVGEAPADPVEFTVR
jgi:hypothetical protein